MGAGGAALEGTCRSHNSERVELLSALSGAISPVGKANLLIDSFTLSFQFSALKVAHSQKWVLSG